MYGPLNAISLPPSWTATVTGTHVSSSKQSSSNVHERVRAGCRSSPDCPFRIRANFLEKRGYAKVTTCDDVHNCTSTSDHLVSQNIPRAETCKLKFLIGAVPNLLAVTKETTTGNIIEAVERKYGQKIALRMYRRSHEANIVC